MIKVLVTCVGSGVGQSVVDSLNLKREHYGIIGCDGNRNVYAHSFCDDFYVVSSLYSEGYIDEIIKICIIKKVDIVIPGHDHELTLFAKELKKFKDNNIKVLVSEPVVTKISRDKQEWYNYFSSKGCKIVPTLSVSEFKKNIDASIFPAIVKPSGGSASQGISIINVIDDLQGLKGDDIIQPYLFPEKEDVNYEAIKKAVSNGDFVQKSEISIQLLFNSKSKHAATFISKNTLKNGVPVFVDPIDPNTFKYLDEILKFVPILENKGVKGPVNIQGRVTPNGLYFFEMNMRFTGITGNRALLGFNEVDYLVRDFLGKKASVEGYANNKLGVRQVACSTISRPKDKIEKKFLTILGAGSNLGKNFIDKIDYNEYIKIYLVARKGSLNRYREFFVHPVIEIISEQDIKLSEFFAQTDVLVNFVSALAFQEDELKYDAIRYLYKMIPKISKAKIPTVINISSQSVYDQKETLSKTENSKVVAKTSYAFQKLMIEDFMLSIKEFNVQSNVLNLRLPRVLNTKDIKQLGFFGIIVANYINNIETVIEFPNNQTNLMDIEDVSEVIDFIIKNEINEPILNVSGENISMKAYCDELKKQLPKENEVLIFGGDLGIENSSQLNGDKLLSYGWKPNFLIKDIIEKIIKTIINA